MAHRRRYSVMVMMMNICEAKGTHKEYNFVRDVWCSLSPGHKGRHIAYWNHVITDEWEEQTSGEIGGPGGGKFFNWDKPERLSILSRISRGYLCS